MDGRQREFLRFEESQQTPFSNSFVLGRVTDAKEQSCVSYSYHNRTKTSGIGSSRSESFMCFRLIGILALASLPITPALGAPVFPFPQIDDSCDVQKNDFQQLLNTIERPAVAVLSAPREAKLPFENDSFFIVKESRAARQGTLQHLLDTISAQPPAEIGPPIALAAPVVESPFFIQKPGIPVATEATLTDIGAAVKAAQEWNVLISEEFRAITPVATGAELFQPEKVQMELNDLSFATMGKHMAALLGDSDSNSGAPQKEPMTEMIQLIAYYGISPMENDQLSTSQSHSEGSTGANSEHEALVKHVQAIQHEDGDYVPIYVEAFQPELLVYGARSQMLSQESSVLEKKRGWQLASGATDHWPTLNWIDATGVKDWSVPLMSANTIHSLGMMEGATQQTTAGIIFGRIAEGWDVEFSGRAERPVFLTPERFRAGASQVPGQEQGQTEHNVDSDPDRNISQKYRYFALLNAQPGAHLLYFTSHVGAGTGAVAIPVMGGTATYMDLVDIQSGPVTGRVQFTGKEARQKGAFDNITVRILGQDSAAGVTDSRGQFHFDNVLTASTYPIYMETDKAGGFTHRYHVLPQERDQVILHRISKPKVMDWLQQLEGGISDTSGLVVGAVPGLVEKFRDTLLLPRVHAIPASKSLIPETYTLSSRGRLSPQTALNLYETRFVGVQVPEGLALSQVEDEHGRILWSQLTMASPGVINIVYK